MLRRYHIRLGATTTASGTVKTASTKYNLNGFPLAVEGDLIDCPTCGSQGVIKCVQPRLRDRYNGREYALSDDLCICNCNPPPKLVADQNVKCQTMVVASVESAEEVAPPKRPFDEQTKLAAPPIAGLPYYVETMDGRTFSGRAGADGLLPRIDTTGPDEYKVYWGDEALTKMDEAKA